MEWNVSKKCNSWSLIWVQDCSFSTHMNILERCHAMQVILIKMTTHKGTLFGDEKDLVFIHSVS